MFPSYRNQSMYEDVGTNGRVNDGGVWSKSKMPTVIEDNKIGIPPF